MAEKYNPKVLPKDLKYHVFLSHKMKEGIHDVAVVREIRERLTERGFKCCDVENDFEVGALVDVNINNCIRLSDKVVFFVSKAFMQSEYWTYEVGLAVLKQQINKKVSMLGVVLDADIDNLPMSLQRHNLLIWGDGPEPKEEHFWDRLEDTLCSEKTLSLLSAGNFYHGLAWSYFYGYLKLVLPELSQRIAASEWAEDKDIPVLDKMMILLPDSGFCPNNLNDYDKNIEHKGFIPFKASRAGNVNRDYKSSVYKVTHPTTKQQCYVVPEFATPLMSMYEMCEGKIADLDEQSKLTQKKLFMLELTKILEHENNTACNGTYILLGFKDPRIEYFEEDNTGKKQALFKPDGWSLSELIANRALEELRQRTDVAQAIAKITQMTTN